MQYLTLTEAAFKRQGFDVCNAQNDLTKNYLWMASLLIAADFALLSASLTVIENEAARGLGGHGASHCVDRRLGLGFLHRRAAHLAARPYGTFRLSFEPHSGKEFA